MNSNCLNPTCLILILIILSHPVRLSSGAGHTQRGKDQRVSLTNNSRQSFKSKLDQIRLKSRNESKIVESTASTHTTLETTPTTSTTTTEANQSEKKTGKSITNIPRAHKSKHRYPNKTKHQTIEKKQRESAKFANTKIRPRNKLKSPRRDVLTKSVKYKPERVVVDVEEEGQNRRHQNWKTNLIIEGNSMRVGGKAHPTEYGKHNGVEGLNEVAKRTMKHKGDSPRENLDDVTANNGDEHHSKEITREEVKESSKEDSSHETVDFIAEQVTNAPILSWAEKLKEDGVGDLINPLEDKYDKYIKKHGIKHARQKRGALSESTKNSTRSFSQSLERETTNALKTRSKRDIGGSQKSKRKHRRSKSKKRRNKRRRVSMKKVLRKVKKAAKALAAKKAKQAAQTVSNKAKQQVDITQQAAHQAVQSVTSAIARASNTATQRLIKADSRAAAHALSSPEGAQPTGPQPPGHSPQQQQDLVRQTEQIQDGLNMMMQAVVKQKQLVATQLDRYQHKINSLLRDMTGGDKSDALVRHKRLHVWSDRQVHKAHKVRRVLASEYQQLRRLLHELDAIFYRTAGWRVQGNRRPPQLLAHTFIARLRRPKGRGYGEEQQQQQTEGSATPTTASEAVETGVGNSSLYNPTDFRFDTPLEASLKDLNKPMFS